MYKEKVSIRETAFGSLDFFFKTLGNIVPRRWQLNVKEINLTHLDAFDALSIGIQATNVSIVKAALDLLPLTKSILASGKTTDFMDHTPIVDGTFIIDQFIELTYDNMSCSISRFRMTKTLASAYLALVLASKYHSIELNTGDAHVVIVPEVVEQFFGESLKNPVSAVTIKYIIPVCAITIAHYLEHDSIDEYAEIFRLLITHPLVTFDHVKTKQYLQELQTQLQWFGTRRTSSNKLQALIDKL